MKRLALFPAAAIGALCLFGVQQVSAAVPGVDARGVGAPTTCPATLNVPTINHFDKIVFQIALEPKLTAASPADQDALDKLPRLTPLDIKVVDNPRRVADLKGKVVTFLGALPDAAGRQAIRIDNVLYATAVCLPKAW